MCRCGRARLGPVSPRRAPWRRMRDPNAPNPQDMQRPPSHCAKRGPGADVQAKAAPPARLRRSETVFQIKAYLKNNKTWRLGKAPARPDAAVEVGGADRGRERSRHGGGPQTKPSGAVPLGPHAPRSPGRSPHQPLTSPQLSGNAPVPTRVPRPGRPPCPCHHSHRAPRRAVRACRGCSDSPRSWGRDVLLRNPDRRPSHRPRLRPLSQATPAQWHTCLHAGGPLAQGHVR